MVQKKRVLFFCSFPPPFTGQRIATKFVYDLLGNYANVDLINLSPEQENLKKPSSLKLIVIYIQKYLQLIRTLKKNRFDYVYVVFSSSKSGLLKDNLSAGIIKHYNKGILITHLHCGNYGDNFKGFFFRNLFKGLINKVDKFIFLSPVLNKVEALQNDKAIYLTNTISNEIVCSDNEIRNKLHLSMHKNYLSIFFISNMIKEKGYEDFIDVALILNREKNLNYKINLIGGWPGNGNDKTDFEKKISNLGLNNKIIVHGAINNREKIKAFFLEADIFILPTYYAIEAQPLSIIEALNSGTPVISTRHAAIPDLIQDGVNGYLIKPKDALAIANAIKKLNDRQHWLKIAEQARKSFKANYQPSVFYNKLVEIFD